MNVATSEEGPSKNEAAILDDQLGILVNVAPVEPATHKDKFADGKLSDAIQSKNTEIIVPSAGLSDFKTIRSGAGFAELPDNEFVDNQGPNEKAALNVQHCVEPDVSPENRVPTKGLMTTPSIGGNVSDFKNSTNPKTRGRPKNSSKIAIEQAEIASKPSVEEVCKTFGMTDVPLNLPLSFFQFLVGFYEYAAIANSAVKKRNPNAGTGKLRKLVSAKWRQYREENGHLPEKDKEQKQKSSIIGSHKPKPSCSQNAVSELKNQLEDEKEVCGICEGVDELVKCSKCRNAYHVDCLSFPSENIENKKKWICPHCLNLPIKARIEKILSWRIKEENDEREYLVKWYDISYWNCEWLHERIMVQRSPHLLRAFQRKYNVERPPQLDLTEETFVFYEDTENNTIWSNKYKELCCNGVEPGWLTVHRVISHFHVQAGPDRYLVKWLGLPYKFVTWEAGSSNIPGLNHKIENYKRLLESAALVKPNRKSKKRQAGNHNSNEKSDEKCPSTIEKYSTQPTIFNELKLHPYQLEGLNWLRHSWAHNISTILADEMGLGKTVQTIAFLYSLYKEGHNNGPFLIAVPLSTIINWEREFELWAPDMYCVTYIGEKISRDIILQYDMSFDGFSTPLCRARLKFQVLLTSFELVSQDAEILNRINWSILVIDEAHRLKSDKSLFFRSLSKYKTAYKLLLTGTPLQNNLAELFHLLNFLCNTKFNDLQAFQNELTDISREDQVKRLHELIGPHMLRRMKTDVLRQMPAKTELIVRVELSEIQKRFYKNILTKNYEALNGNQGSKSCSLINVMMDLKKCCNHPYLFPAGAEQAQMNTLSRYEIQNLTESSGKLELLAKMLKKLKEQGHRVLIFSQMTKMLDLLEDFLIGHGYLFERLDGTITGTQRQAAIDRFNAPGAKEFVFLLSTRAGGLGINLATADTVVIYDSDWNPHNDIQALSRAHRLGQVKDVLILRFVTRNTIEERIAQVAKKKMMLMHLVVRAGTESNATKLTKKELDDILRFGAEELFKEDQSKEPIHYDEKAVEDLLDRTKCKIADNDENLNNEYLSSFKVASYAVKETEEAENQDFTSDKENGEYQTSSAFWTNLLKTPHEQQCEVAIEMGKGKRIRHLILPKGMVEDELAIDIFNSTQHDDNVTQDADFKGPSEGEATQQPSFRGFNTRQRKSFCNGFMRLGIPPNGDFDLLPRVWDLRKKTDKDMRRYGLLFGEHLSGKLPEDVQMYSDDSFCDGFKRQDLLLRAFQMSLIRRKVDEYKNINGTHSLPNEQTDHVETPNEMHRFAFNIADDRFSRLHKFWEREEALILLKPQNKMLVWNRRHDYWLLAGIATHGYGRWNEIQKDERFAIINVPFAQDYHNKNGPDAKLKFMKRRFELLQYALCAEDQIENANALHPENNLNPEMLDLKETHDKLLMLVRIIAHLNPVLRNIMDRRSKNDLAQRVDSLLVAMQNNICLIPTEVSELTQL